MSSFPLLRADRLPAFGFLCACALALVACEPAQELPAPVVAAGESFEFGGSWNAVGNRRTIPLGGERKGSVIRLSGTMLLAGQGRPGVGYRSEVIALVDTETGLVGRSVWTDERGDQVFSELKGDDTSARNHLVGTIFGGTGRYAGAIGSYEFSWQYVIESEDGALQGSAVGLKGRIRFDAKPAVSQP